VTSPRGEGGKDIEKFSKDPNPPQSREKKKEQEPGKCRCGKLYYNLAAFSKFKGWWGKED